MFDSTTPLDHLIHLAIFGGIAAGLISGVFVTDFHPMAAFMQKHAWAASIVIPSVIWFVLGLVLLTMRTVLWLIYRPFKPASATEAPFLTVVIPAYNEGELVRRSILSSARAEYPRDKLEIIVVDDGSRDDTWEHIQAAANEHPELVRTIRFEQNRGKRAALAAGFRQARGEVVVTIEEVAPDFRTVL